nr:MAG TPA: hypothetical protein [Caudoviricetes sp.]
MSEQRPNKERLQKAAGRLQELQDEEKRTCER